MPNRLPQRAFLIPFQHSDRLEIVPSNLSMFDTIYDRKLHSEYRSVVKKTQHGKYVQTSFEHIRDY